MTPRFRTLEARAKPPRRASRPPPAQRPGACFRRFGSSRLAVRGLEEPAEYLSLGIRYGGFSGYPYVLSSDADDSEVAAAEFRESLREFNETLREANETLREANELLGKPKASRAHETTAAAEEAGARADGSTPYDPRLSAAATRSRVLAAVGWGGGRVEYGGYEPP